MPTLERRRWVRSRCASSFHMTALLLCLGTLLAMNSSHATDAVKPLASDHPEHAELLEAASGPAEDVLGVPFTLQVDLLQRSGDFAFLLAQLRSPAGARFDFSATPLAEQAESGSLSDVYAVLLRVEDGEWRVLTHVLGPGDMAWANWAGDFDAPEALFRSH